MPHYIDDAEVLYDEFIHALNDGDVDALRVLLRQPQNAKLLDVKLVRQANQGALHMACARRNPAVVELLISKNADALAQDDLLRMPLHIAANTGDPNLLSTLLGQHVDAKIDTIKDVHQRTAFHALCMGGSIYSEKCTGDELQEALDLLLRGYKVDAEKRMVLQQLDFFGITAAQYAKHYNFQDLLSKMQAIGIPLDSIADITPNHPSITVNYWGFSKIMMLAFKSRAGDTSERIKRTEAIRTALQADGDTNDPRVMNTQFGHINALHCAAVSGSADAVGLLLLDPRVDALSADIKGRNALHYACKRAESTVLQRLLECNALKLEVNKKDKNGMTPLHILVVSSVHKPLAVFNENLRLLCRAGANLFALNAANKSAAQLANETGNLLLFTALQTVMAEQNIVDTAARSVAAAGLRKLSSASEDQVNVPVNGSSSTQDTIILEDLAPAPEIRSVIEPVITRHVMFAEEKDVVPYDPSMRPSARLKRDYKEPIHVAVRPNTRSRALLPDIETTERAWDAQIAATTTTNRVKRTRLSNNESEPEAPISSRLRGSARPQI